ncbi:hypothetical protein MNBD_GAMMA21-2029 [hydrothermal vent metagenome]|uniref:Uncharacterized protein n=1 Tax=hydrothermal vent metagenome TaxID=652676 RepID=A0A3B1AJL1_9ZZZZ
MSFLGNTISRSSQRLGERTDYGADNKCIGIFIGGHKHATKLSLMHVGINMTCLPISNEQNDHYASDRMT